MNLLRRLLPLLAVALLLPAAPAVLGQGGTTAPKVVATTTGTNAELAQVDPCGNTNDSFANFSWTDENDGRQTEVWGYATANPDIIETCVIVQAAAPTVNRLGVTRQIGQGGMPWNSRFPLESSPRSGGSRGKWRSSTATWPTAWTPFASWPCRR